jgi:uncharacterized protein (TIGR04255 family)
MKLPRKLGKEPLLEAVFEMRFKSGTPASNVLPGLLFANLDGEKTIERLPAAQIPQQMRDADPNLRYAPLIRIHWGAYFILVGDRNLGLACNKPYPGWSAFKPTILTLIKSVTQVGIIEAVERVSLKYLDILPSDLGSANFLMEFALRVGQHAVENDLFQIRVEIPRTGFLHIVQISSSGTANFSDGNSITGAAIDIDTIALVDDMQLSQFVKMVESQLEVIHTDNKAMFFECLKHTTIEALEPSYDD